MTLSRLAFVLYSALSLALAGVAVADHHEASELAVQPEASELAVQSEAGEVAGQAEAADDAPSPKTGAVAEAATPRAPASPGSVARASFARGIADREPSEPLADEASASAEVVFFTELRDLDGETVTHRWEWNGQVMAEVPFEVGGPRWRVWSTKKLQPEWLGAWTVSVLDGNGSVLAGETLTLHAVETAETAEKALDAAPPASPAGD